MSNPYIVRLNGTFTPLEFGAYNSGGEWKEALNSRLRIKAKVKQEVDNYLQAQPAILRLDTESVTKVKEDICDTIGDEVLRHMETTPQQATWWEQTIGRYIGRFNEARVKAKVNQEVDNYLQAQPAMQRSDTELVTNVKKDICHIIGDDEVLRHMETTPQEATWWELTIRQFIGLFNEARVERNIHPPGAEQEAREMARGNRRELDRPADSLDSKLTYNGFRLGKSDATKILSKMRTLFYEQCEPHKDVDFVTFCEQIDEPANQKDMTKKAYELIEIHWVAAKKDWFKYLLEFKWTKDAFPEALNYQALNDQTKQEMWNFFWLGLESGTTILLQQEKGVGYFIKNQDFQGYVDQNTRMSLHYAQALFEMKRSFAEALIRDWQDKILKETNSDDQGERHKERIAKGLRLYKIKPRAEPLKTQRPLHQQYPNHRVFIRNRKGRPPMAAREHQTKLVAMREHDQYHRCEKRDAAEEQWWGRRYETGLFLL